MRDTITEEQLVEFFKETFHEADNARKPIQSKWDDAWNVYNNYYDFSDKAKWQSQNYLPKFKMAVRNAAGILKKSLVQARNFFYIEGENDESKLLEKDIEDAIERVLSQSEFVPSFNEATIGGLLENLLCFKIFPVPLSDTDRPIHPDQIYKFKIVPTSMFNVWLDPTGRDRYKINRVTLDLADYRALVKKGVYLESSLKYVESDYRNKDQEYREVIRKGQTDVIKPKWRKEVELMEYWGDVDDEFGNRLFSNVTFTVVNRQHLARRPLKNTYDSDPFVLGPIIKKPFSVYHEGFGDGVIPIAKLMVEIMNQEVDANLYAAIKAFVLHLDYVHNPTDIKSGVYPGKTIKAKGVPPGGKVIEEITLGEASPNGMVMLSALDREFQNGTAITDHVAGLAGAGTKTATEYKGRITQNLSAISSIAEDIEQRVLDHVIERIYDLILQWNPEIFGPKIHQVPKEILKFQFKARGMSQVLQRENEAQKAMMLLSILGKTPLGQRVNWKEIGNKVINAVGWDPAKILLDEQAESPTIGNTPPTPKEAAFEAQKNKVLQWGQPR